MFITLDYNCCVLTKELTNRLGGQLKAHTTEREREIERLVEDTRNTIYIE